MVFLFSFFDVTERKKKFCGGIFRVDDDDNDCDSGLVVAPDMLPRLYFLFLTNFFLSSFFDFKYLCLFQYYFIKKLFVCVLFFFSCPSPIYYLAEGKKIGCSICTFHFFSFRCFVPCCDSSKLYLLHPEETRKIAFLFGYCFSAREVSCVVFIPLQSSILCHVLLFNFNFFFQL